MAAPVPPAPPELPELLPCELGGDGEADELVLSEGLVENGDVVAPRRVRVDESALRESLRDVTMPWTDLVGSVAALAASLGISVEAE